MKGRGNLTWPKLFHPADQASPFSVTKIVCPLPTAASYKIHKKIVSSRFLLKNHRSRRDIIKTTEKKFTTTPCSFKALGTLESDKLLSKNGKGAAGVGEGLPSIAKWGAVNPEGRGWESYARFWLAEITLIFKGTYLMMLVSTKDPGLRSEKMSGRF